MPTLLDGKKVAGDIKNEISARVQDLKSKGKRVPNLAIIIVGDDGASHGAPPTRSHASQWGSILPSCILPVPSPRIN